MKLLKLLRWAAGAGLLLSCFFCAPGIAEAAAREPGIVFLGPVADDMLAIAVSCGRVVYGRGTPYSPQNGDAIEKDESGSAWLVRSGKKIGAFVAKNSSFRDFDSLDTGVWGMALTDAPENFIITSPDDPLYAPPGKPALHIFRTSRPADCGRTARGLEAPVEHSLYVKLPAPLTRGRRYRISFSAAPLPVQAFLYDPSVMRSPAVHVSHLGFRPDDPSKTAFVSLWMGSGGPKPFLEGTVFSVIDNATGAEACRGGLRLRAAASSRQEDAYGKSYAGADVYSADFSSLHRPGTYRLCVDGVGCSYTFVIAADAWTRPFTVSVRGLYHQRSGIELGPPHTQFRRPRCFHPADGVQVFASAVRLMDTGNGLAEGGDTFGLLQGGTTGQLLPDAWGGYCDAGDWDRRIQHLEAARLLLELAELFPQFYAGLSLDIPESGDDLPDIVNEALWGLDFFKRLQTPGGGIRGGIESGGHPRYGEASWQESWPVLAYAPDPWSSYVYAGAAARAALWFKKSSRPGRADEYLRSSLRAMQWAEQDVRSNSRAAAMPHQVRDSRNLAAAELFRATGDPAWHELFRATTAFTASGAPLYKHQSHNQAEAAWVYCRTETPGSDASLRSNCRQALLEEADRRLSAQQQAGFGWMKDPWRPVGAGSLTVPDCLTVLRAHSLTGQTRYLAAAVLASQFGAGANPCNICYTTGLGHAWPQHPMHVDSRMGGQAPPPGLTVFGPIDAEKFGLFSDGLFTALSGFCYPKASEWPVLETYWDVYWQPLMCEFLIHQMALNAYVWGYLAARAAPGPPAEAP